MLLHFILNLQYTRDNDKEEQEVIIPTKTTRKKKTKIKDFKSLLLFLSFISLTWCLFRLIRFHAICSLNCFSIYFHFDLGEKTLSSGLSNGNKLKNKSCSTSPSHSLLVCDFRAKIRAFFFSFIPSVHRQITRKHKTSRKKN